MADNVKCTEFEEILEQIMSRKQALPNYEEMPLEYGVACIAAGGGLAPQPGIKSAMLPGETSYQCHWSRYFLSVTQGGALTGSGYVMFYDNGKGRIGKFAICKHVLVEGAGANHSRGWHPGYCKVCGLDMTVDSSD
jgi:hypothetical protein